MKDRIIKYSTMGSYLLLYVIVAIVSLISSIHFFDLAHAGWMSIVLACSFEIGQMACLFGALTRKKTGFDIVWLMFVALTLFQCMANTYAAYIGLGEFQGWSELFGLTDLELIDQKRIIASISGAMLPLIALGFIKCLVDFMNEKTDEPVVEVIEENNEEIKEYVVEESHIKPKKEPKVFEGGVFVSDEEVKELENSAPLKGVSDAKEKMEEALSKLQNMVNL